MSKKESELKRIVDLSRFSLKEDTSQTQSCPDCSGDMVYKGCRTAEPWPEDEKVYDVHAYHCKKCNVFFEYWPEKMV